jgi:hypothetical protein
VIAKLNAGSYAFQLSTKPYPVWVEFAKVKWSPGCGMRVLPVQSPALTGEVTDQLNRAPVQP